jgi:Tfp pilus assembly protein PilN
MSQQVNLYHPIFRKQEKKFSALTMMQAALLVLVAIVLMYAYAVWQVRALRHQAGQVEQQYRAVSRQFEEMSRQLAARQVNPRYAKEVARLEGRIQAVQTIRELARHDYFFGGDGYSDYFIAFARQGVPGLWLTGFTVTGAGEQLALEGRTETPELVPQFLQKLSAEKLLSGTEFDAFQMTRPENDGRKGYAGYVDFSVRTRDANPARPEAAGGR